ncbi:MAG TPA: hypothetical protein VGF24_24790 [Vicinamibacterales bacterium]|jgi:hypothetical protein
MGELRKRGGKYWIGTTETANGMKSPLTVTRRKWPAICCADARVRLQMTCPSPRRSNRFRFEEAAADLVAEYKANGRRSLDEVEHRIEKHLAPFFGGRRIALITTSEIRTYIAQRQAATEVVKKAYTITREDGTTITVPEQRRSTLEHRTQKSIAS